MLWNIISAILMGAMSILMLNLASYAKTRKMALIPIGSVIVEMIMLGAVNYNSFFVTLSLLLLRIVMLASCYFALQDDIRTAARKKSKIKKVKAKSSQTNPNFFYNVSPMACNNKVCTPQNNNCGNCA